MDLKSGYWQVEMDKTGKEKTAFSTGKRLFQFTVMPFGLCNAPATFDLLGRKGEGKGIACGFFLFVCLFVCICLSVLFVCLSAQNFSVFLRNRLSD